MMTISSLLYACVYCSLEEGLSCFLVVASALFLLVVLALVILLVVERTWLPLISFSFLFIYCFHPPRYASRAYSIRARSCQRPRTRCDPLIGRGLAPGKCSWAYFGITTIQVKYILLVSCVLEPTCSFRLQEMNRLTHHSCVPIDCSISILF